jgi:hypothetical protein
MPRRISAAQIEEAYEPVEVDLWSDKGGAVFAVVEITKPLQDKVNELQRSANDVADEDQDQALAFIAQMFDAVLRPIDGGRRKASIVVMARWKDGKASVGTLYELLRQIGEAGRPT